MSLGPNNQLPVDPFLPLIGQEWEKNQIFLIKSPPGTGKTTRIPRFLLGLTPKKILALAPRKVAVRMAARRVAQEMGERLGGRVGHAFRFEQRVEAQTQLIFFTEGTFLKYLQRNPDLKEVGAIVLDEFHERHIETDGALALIMDLLKKRHELKLLVMTATIDFAALLDYFARHQQSVYMLDIPVGIHPVTTEYLSPRDEILGWPLEKMVWGAVEKMIERQIPGDILIFLPGMREILGTQKILLAHLEREGGWNIYLLHGDLERKGESEQEAIFGGAIKGKRKIVLATNIAESSVTIPGISIVIDTGLKREAVFSPWSGLTELKTKKAAQNSCDQRRGRSHREGPGFCLRLFTQVDFESRPESDVPEILRSDLVPLLLTVKELAPVTPQWFEAPPLKAWELAEKTLWMLEVLDEASANISDFGKKVMHFSLPVRLGCLLVRMIERGIDGTNNVQSFLKELADWEEAGSSHQLQQMLRQQLESFHKKNRPQFAEKELNLEDFFRRKEELYLWGFMDQVALLRHHQQHKEFIHQNGEVLRFSPLSSQYAEIEVEGTAGDLQKNLYLILEVNPKKEVLRCVPCEYERLYELNRSLINEKINVFWDEKKKKIVRELRIEYGVLLIEREERRVPLLRESIDVQKKVQEILWKQAKVELANFWQSSLGIKVKFMAEKWQKGKAFDEESFAKKFTEWAQGQEEFQSTELIRMLIDDLFESRMGLTDIELSLPEFWINKAGRKLVVTYQSDGDAVIEGMIQDFYGEGHTPQLGKSGITPRLSLTGPHGRSMQVTRDLAGFWQKTYPLLRKEFMREYPRHYWPEVPEKDFPYLIKRHQVAAVAAAKKGPPASES